MFRSLVLVIVLASACGNKKNEDSPAPSSPDPGAEPVPPPSRVEVAPAELVAIAQAATREIHDARTALGTKFAYGARGHCERALPAIEKLGPSPEHAALVKDIDTVCMVELPAAAIRTLADEAEEKKQQSGKAEPPWCVAMHQHVTKFHATLAKRNLADAAIKGHLERWNAVCGGSSRVAF